MNSDYKISKLEAIFLILIVMINKIILNVPKSIIRLTGTGSLVNIIFVGALALILVILIVKLFKNFPNEDIIDVSEYIGGKILKTIVGIGYIILFGIVICTVIIRFTELLKVVYFENSPYIYITGFFLIAIGFANKFGFKSIIKTNFIILPFIFASIVFILFGISNYISPSSLYPILGNNIKNTFVDGISNIFAFSGIAYLFFTSPLLKNKKDLKSIGITFITLSTLFLFIVVGALLLVFPFITHSEELLSVYILVRLVEFGEFIQRADALFIYLWIISAFSYLSIALMFILNIFKKLTHATEHTELSFSLYSIILGITLLLKDSNLLSFIEDVIYKYYLIIFVFGISTIIMLLANIKKKFFKKSPTPDNQLKT